MPSTSTEATPFDVAVANQRTKIQERYDNGGYISFRDEPTIYRHTATKAQRVVKEYSLGGVAGLLLAGAFLVVAFTQTSLDGDDDLVFLALVVSVAIWVAGGWVGHLFTRSAVLPVGWATSGFGEIFGAAVEEIESAVHRGVPGAADAYDATQQMRPGFEELLVEHSTLVGAAERFRYGSFHTGYLDALIDERTRVKDVLLDVCAEVSAAAAAMFATRPNLLVDMQAAQVEVRVRSSALTDAGQEALANARQLLAESVRTR